MDWVTSILRQATAAVQPGYFWLEIAGGSPIYRERVYCYELYHQMRCIWPRGTEFYLNAEVDKRAHPLLKRLHAEKIPDLLIHKPGIMDGNNTIIEVKSCCAKDAGIRKDLITLSDFIDKVRYKRGILLIFGNETSQDVEDRILRIAHEIGELPPIELWCHETPKQPARLIRNTLGNNTFKPSSALYQHG